jgi:4-amino-4-deoxy-L-arabinose transferase-like glycosyltransferase
MIAEISPDLVEADPALQPLSSPVPAPAMPGELTGSPDPGDDAGLAGGPGRVPQGRRADADALAVLMSLARPQAPAPPRPPLPPQPAPPPQAAPPAASAAVPVARPVGRVLSRSSAWSGLGTGTRWPLSVVLLIQAALSLRLIWSNTAFPDEALYLWAGRLEISHLLHGGTALPDFASYFSGAPVLYPPLGAAVADVFGLPGARLLSLGLMLGATVLLHGITRRLFDRRAAFFAAALFAGLAATQFLGAFATYDAMALFLLAAASWLGIAATERTGRAAVKATAAAAAVLALANATKYASALFDPVILTMVAAASWQRRGRLGAIRSAWLMLGVLAFLLAAGVALGGGSYLHGVLSTTLARAPGTYSEAFLLYTSAKWLWPVAVLAGFGVLAAATAGRGRSFLLLAIGLAAAITLAPVDQARIHTYTSLFKHDGYGAWFACMLAGYALAALSRVVPQAKALAAFRAGVLAVVLVAIPAVPTAAAHYGWPNSTRLMTAMRKVLAAYRGENILADDNGQLLNYYLGAEMAHRSVTGTWYFSYPSPSTGRLEDAQAYAAAIRQGHFSVIMLECWDNRAVDIAIMRDASLAATHYRLYGRIPYSATGAHGWFYIFVHKGAS